jgi:hypothetical protein
MSRARLGGTTFARSAIPSNWHNSLSDVCSAVDIRFWSVDLVFLFALLFVFVSLLHGHWDYHSTLSARLAYTVQNTSLICKSLCCFE